MGLGMVPFGAAAFNEMALCAICAAAFGAYHRSWLVAVGIFAGLAAFVGPLLWRLL